MSDVNYYYLLIKDNILETTENMHTAIQAFREGYTVIDVIPKNFLVEESEEFITWQKIPEK